MQKAVFRSFLLAGGLRVSDRQVRPHAVVAFVDLKCVLIIGGSLGIAPLLQVEITFFKASLNGATNLWLGCWWDDGSYPTAADYFAAHPSATGHHTVPITTG
jgi:hypothetical protein